MKKITKFIALLATIIICTSALVACENDPVAAKNFELANYAHPLDSAYAKSRRSDFSEKSNVYPERNTFVKTNYSSLAWLGSGRFCRATLANGTYNSSYAFYDIINDREIATKLYDIDSYSLNYFYDYDYRYYYVTTTYDNGNYLYKIYGPDGSPVVNEYFSNQNFNFFFYSSYDYTDGDGYTVTVYGYEFTYNLNSERKSKYFATVNVNGETTWKQVSKDELEGHTPNSSVGEVLGLTKQNIVSADDYPNSNYKDYTYTVEGYGTSSMNALSSCTVTFYKGDTEKGSVSIKGGNIIGFAGKYLYYCEMTPVSADAKSGYDVEIAAYNIKIKTKYQLYRYNFIDGKKKAEKVNSDYIITGSATPLYNYSTKEFDKFYVQAYKKTSGVAVITELTTPALMVFTDKAKPVADLMSSNISSPANVYKLSNTRYLAGNYIIDENCKTVASLSSSATVWNAKKLIYTSGKFVDYNGRVVLDPEAIDAVYGDIIVYSDSKTTLYSTAYPSGKSIDEVVRYDKDTQTIDYDDGFIYVGTPTLSSGSSYYNYYKYTIYDLNGKEVTSITNCRALTIASAKDYAYAVATLENGAAVYIIK